MSKYQIFTCNNCNNILTTSKNANFFLDRYEDEDIPNKIKSKSINLQLIIFTVEEDELKHFILNPKKYEYLLRKDDNTILCKKCEKIIGEIKKINFEEEDLNLCFGILDKEKIKVFEEEEESLTQNIKIYNQNEFETLDNLKEVKCVVEQIKEMTKKIISENIVDGKKELLEIDRILKESKLENFIEEFNK